MNEFDEISIQVNKAWANYCLYPSSETWKIYFELKNKQVEIAKSIGKSQASLLCFWPTGKEGG